MKGVNVIGEARARAQREFRWRVAANAAAPYIPLTPPFALCSLLCCSFYFFFFFPL